jgi:CRP-like cAMP-binding protein
LLDAQVLGPEAPSIGEAGMARIAALPRSGENPKESFPLIDKLSAYLPLSQSEAAFLRDLHGSRRQIDRHRDIIAQGRPYRSVFILCSGFVWRYKILPDGKRQLLSFGLPGDLIGFPAAFFENAVNATGSLSNVVVATVPFAMLHELFAKFPRVAVALYWMAAREAAIYGERIVDIGRRSAYERLAHLILELLARLRADGLAEQRSYILPLTQELIADVLGLSGPHVCRMLRSMREEGLVTIEGHRLTVTDLESLTALAGFDGDYLARSSIPGLTAI